MGDLQSALIDNTESLLSNDSSDVSATDLAEFNAVRMVVNQSITWKPEEIEDAE